VDAIFGPVKRVNWEVTSARVGQSTNYDKLVLEIWTDGTVSPEHALSASAKLIIDHLRMVAGINEETLTVVTEREIGGSRLSSELAETPVEALDLPCASSTRSSVPASPPLAMYWNCWIKASRQ